MKNQKRDREIANELSFVTRGLADFASMSGIGIGFNEPLFPFRKLETILKDKIRPLDLAITNEPEKANFKVILFSAFDNEDGYDCMGILCIPREKKGDFPGDTSVGYCGVCGDVITLRFTEKNSKVLYLISV